MSHPHVENQPSPAGPVCDACGRELAQCRCEEWPSRPASSSCSSWPCWNGTFTVTGALQLVGAHFAVGLVLFLLRHWRQWVWRLAYLPRFLLVCAAWPYYVVTGHFFEEEEEPAVVPAGGARTAAASSPTIVARTPPKDWADERANEIVEHFVRARAMRIGLVPDLPECWRLAEDIAMTIRSASEHGVPSQPPPEA